MGRWISNFNNTSELATFSGTSDFSAPHVSLTKNDRQVHFFEDPYNGHACVDLGLPSGLKWAAMNIGATDVTDAGLYFQWGDISGYTRSEIGPYEGQKAFNWDSYKYWSSDTGGGSSGMTKYNSTDGLTALASTDDAAMTNWGSNWRMPTSAEFIELGNYTTSAFTNNCLVLTSTINGNTLTFPAGGVGIGTYVVYTGTDGCYWSNSLYGGNVIKGVDMLFHSSDVNWNSYYDRSYGLPIRPVFG